MQQRQHKLLQLLFACVQKLGIWKIITFFSELARAKTGFKWQRLVKGGSGEPHHTHYSPQYGDKKGRKNLID